MKINVLGTEYDYAEIDGRDDPRLTDCDGYCDYWEKTIRVDIKINENNPNGFKNIPAYIAKVKRHEILHGMLVESGLKDYSHDEQLVDWIAYQFPKMLKLFEETGAL